jgi:hypothetical protein
MPSPFFLAKRCQVCRQWPDLLVGRPGRLVPVKTKPSINNHNCCSAAKEFSMSKYLLTSAAILLALFAVTSDADAATRRPGGIGARRTPSRPSGRQVHTAHNHGHYHHTTWRAPRHYSTRWTHRWGNCYGSVYSGHCRYRTYYRPGYCYGSVIVRRPVTSCRTVVYQRPVTCYRPVTYYRPVTCYRPVTTCRPVTCHRPTTRVTTTCRTTASRTTLVRR